MGDINLTPSDAVTTPHYSVARPEHRLLQCGTPDEHHTHHYMYDMLPACLDIFSLNRRTQLAQSAGNTY
jgi:hypothetical protein